jgi:hypothetical protein
MTVGADEEKQQAITDFLSLAARTGDEALTGIAHVETAVEPGAPAWWHGEEEAGQEALAMVRRRGR